jgi:hypothetical protein
MRRIAATVWNRPSSARVTAPGRIEMMSDMASYLKTGSEGRTNPTDARLAICSIIVFCKPTVAFRYSEYAVPATTPIRIALFPQAATCRTTRW